MGPRARGKGHVLFPTLRTSTANPIQPLDGHAHAKRLFANGENPALPALIGVSPPIIATGHRCGDGNHGEYTQAESRQRDSVLSPG